jgi:hypothetical protein
MRIGSAEYSGEPEINKQKIRAISDQFLLPMTLSIFIIQWNIPLIS